jgi:hypothetical protein
MHTAMGAVVSLTSNAIFSPDRARALWSMLWSSVAHLFGGPAPPFLPGP